MGLHSFSVRDVSGIRTQAHGAANHNHDHHNNNKNNIHRNLGSLEKYFCVTKSPKPFNWSKKSSERCFNFCYVNLVSVSDSASGSLLVAPGQILKQLSKQRQMFRLLWTLANYQIGMARFC